MDECEEFGATCLLLKAPCLAENKARMEILRSGGALNVDEKVSLPKDETPPLATSRAPTMTTPLPNPEPADASTETAEQQQQKEALEKQQRDAHARDLLAPYAADFEKPTFTVTVTDPQKVGDGAMNAYVLYKVTTMVRITRLALCVRRLIHTRSVRRATMLDG